METAPGDNSEVDSALDNSSDPPTESLSRYWMSCPVCHEQGTITRPIGEVPTECPECTYGGIFIREL